MSKAEIAQGLMEVDLVSTGELIPPKRLCRLCKGWEKNWMAQQSVGHSCMHVGMPIHLATGWLDGSSVDQDTKTCWVSNCLGYCRCFRHPTDPTYLLQRSTLTDGGFQNDQLHLIILQPAARLVQAPMLKGGHINGQRQLCVPESCINGTSLCLQTFQFFGYALERSAPMPLMLFIRVEFQYPCWDGGLCHTIKTAYHKKRPHELNHSWCTPFQTGLRFKWIPIRHFVRFRQ